MNPHSKWLTLPISTVAATISQWLLLRIDAQSFPASTKGWLHMENYVGKRLDGRYEIQEIIGVGGWPFVYKAYDNN